MDAQGNSYRLRLNRFLARAGVESRRKAEALIASGRVQVNGETVVNLATTVDPAHDEVSVDGERVFLRSEQVTLLLNKPAGVYTTMRDPQGRPCVADLVPTERYPGIFPVGRLDRDTTGLLLFTTDGNLGQALGHPSHHMDKTYIAQVEGTPTAVQLQQLCEGVDIKVGERQVHTAPGRARLLHRSDLAELPFTMEHSCLQPDAPGTSLVEVSIHQGMKHQVKLMLGALGHRVVHLHRISFGPLAIKGAEIGSVRAISEEDRTQLYRAAGLL